MPANCEKQQADDAWLPGPAVHDIGGVTATRQAGPGRPLGSGWPPRQLSTSLNPAVYEPRQPSGLFIRPADELSCEPAHRVGSGRFGGHLIRLAHQVTAERVPAGARVSAVDGLLRPVESDSAIAQAHVRITADDDVVEDADVEQLPGRDRLRGEVQIVR
jgi:hypothetical protein